MHCLATANPLSQSCAPAEIYSIVHQERTCKEARKSQEFAAVRDTAVCRSLPKMVLSNIAYIPCGRDICVGVQKSLDSEPNT